MTDHDDDLLHQLAALDPTSTEAPPAPGSSRHDEILERAMTASDVPTPSTGPTEVPLGPDPIPVGRRAWPGRVLVALAAAVVLVVAVVVVDPFGSSRPASATQVIRSAATTTGEALTLRSEYRQDDDQGGLSVIRSEHRGADVARRYFRVDASGHERPGGDSDEAIVYIGEHGWLADGTRIDVPRSQRNAPYAPSSAAIVRAAVTPSTTTEIGPDDVRGQAAVHYRIRLDAAAIRRLSALPVNQRSGFELEYPSNVRSLDVWVGGGHLLRIRVLQDFEPQDGVGTTVEFYDFGADIHITPPRGS